MNPIFADLPTSIFEIMSLEARTRGAVNLGQGFPETDGFPEVREAAARALGEQSNQYAPMRGLPVLRQAVSAFYARTQGLAFDPDSEVMITSGATEAISAAILAFVTPGDEVVLFEPMYDAYLPLVRRAGGVPKIVQLRPPHWTFGEDDLAAVFSDRTRLVLLTTPNNPTTHAVTRAELDLLARYCERHDAYVMSDEVWEQVIFDQPHLSVLHVPGLKDRAVKIGSAGKIFSLTGWKVGFVCGPKPLVDQMARAHQFITFATPPALQHGVAFGLGLPQARFDTALSELREQRDYLAGHLARAGFRVMAADGTYFVNIDLGEAVSDPVAFAFELVARHGVATIPLKAFCDSGRNLPILRLCFAKSRATLDRGIAGLVSAQERLL
ncbi:aminotransferase [Asticcacaulis solisilvae]|uniref:aminotransferase n=1 Tax=Asticcacaulis solisilvae TaxID=1217274 RepID=UPI003FD7F860